MILGSIVSYNNSNSIEECIHSCIQHFDAMSKLIVFDNCSTDGTREILKELEEKYVEKLEVKYLEQNIGFGKAHNLILDYNIDVSHYLVINPDVFVKEDSLDRLLTKMKSDQSIGLVVPKFLNPDGSLQAQNKKLPTVFDLFLRRLPFSIRKFFSKRLDEYVCLDHNYDESWDVLAISGAFFLVKGEVFRQLKGFDRRYFLYFEDVDLGRMVQSLGLRTVYEPSAKVFHLWNRTSHKEINVAMVLVQNGIKYFNKWGWKYF